MWAAIEKEARKVFCCRGLRLFRKEAEGRIAAVLCSVPRHDIDGMPRRVQTETLYRLEDLRLPPVSEDGSRKTRRAIQRGSLP
mmetsp:Transcript_141576/g.359631  ORF Transcript_141576/g.359631 Transcript_141576/m.359631 type:complete len:83 (+) Transcript_141576:1378-1626(+)